MSSTVLTHREGAVCVVTLNRPERLNAINVDLLADLNAALEAAMADDEVGAVVLTGAGRAFCAGDDLIDQEDMRDWPEERVRGFAESIQDVTRHIMYGPAPVIAAVHGWAVGGAFSWPINADFAIWAEDARAFFPELRYGLFVSGGVTHLLPAFVGRAKAAEMLYLGHKYGARELAECGLAHAIVPGGDLMPAALRLAEEVAALAPAARRAMKASLNQIERAELDEAMARETRAVVEGVMDPETYRRIAAISERGRS